MVAVIAVLTSVPAAAQDTGGVGAVRGTVLSTTGVAVGHVAVCAAAAGPCAVSDAQGRFRLESLRPGRYVLDVIPPNQPTLTGTDVEVRAGLDSVVEVTLPVAEALTESVTITAPRLQAPGEIKTSGFLVGADAVLSSAGALQDVSRFVQVLPGVVIGTDDFRNDLIVRGGSPLENLYIVDNIEIPNINTFATFASAGGTVSMLDAQLIRDVTFLTGGFPAPYGNRTSSVLQVAQREGSRDQVRGRATVGFAGAGVVAEGPIGVSRRGSWVTSVRRSFLDLFADDIGFGGVPVLYTVNGKAVYDLTPTDRVWLVHVSGLDRIRLGLTETSDPTEELSNLDIRYRGERSATGFNWQRLLGTRGVGLFGATWSRAAVNQQVKDLLRRGEPNPGVPVEEQIADADIVFRERSVEREATVKYDLTLGLPWVRKLQAGVSAKVFDIDYDTASPFGTDSPYFPRDANPFAIRTGLRTWQPSGYLQATRPLLPRLDVTAGLRWDDYRYLSARRLNPRLGVSYAVSNRVSLTGAFGRYAQQPFFLFLAAFPENRQLAPFRADHLVGGVVVDGGGGRRLTVEVYRKPYRDYPASSQIGALSLANIGDTFALRDILFPMASVGTGLVRGVEVFVERRADPARRLSGQANLSWSRTRHAGVDGVPRPGSFDYPVVANVLAAHRLTSRWDVSLRVAYLDGRPYTPVDPVGSAAERRAVHDVARVNAERLPDYFRADLRVDRRLTAWGRPVVVFAGVQNVTGRRNVASYSWDRRNNVPRLGEQLGVFPVLGLDWSF